MSVDETEILNIRHHAALLDEVRQPKRQLHVHITSRKIFVTSKYLSGGDTAVAICLIPSLATTLSAS